MTEADDTELARELEEHEKEQAQVPGDDPEEEEEEVGSGAAGDEEEQ